jgi:hypothetical protein
MDDDDFPGFSFTTEREIAKSASLKYSEFQRNSKDENRKCSVVTFQKQRSLNAFVYHKFFTF